MGLHIPPIPHRATFQHPVVFRRSGLAGRYFLKALAWPSQTLTVTFTNKAAREMRERALQLIGDAGEGLRWLGTFHSISAQILRRHAELAGLDGSERLADERTQHRC